MAPLGGFWGGFPGVTKVLVLPLVTSRTRTKCSILVAPNGIRSFGKRW
jgi:hypothetical protein